ncbi:MAG: hypothetical protein JWM36_3854 [Hyphomicrobiales bacterium]|nr:hypothetical protein [Hyphomicrobiales bacterium]
MTSFSHKLGQFGAPLGRAALVALSAGMVSACQDTGANGKAFRPIPPETVALMEQKGTTRQAPILIRAYKKEAELEIWKMKADGQYTLLKSFPMCRWSGQLGPKRREGDRQVPEGFYTITPGQMNPNSNYYLSFNVGYPNALDRAQGYTGGSIMVHGACSSAGCFSMTDQQIEEIYAIARDAFAGGQRSIQMQSLPFRMTPENVARHRLDPNMAFWKQLKEGSDRFEVTKRELVVNYCGRHYVFDASSALPGQGLEASDACPPLKQDPSETALLVQKQKHDDAKVAELIAQGVQPIKVVYSDGGQHPSMASVLEVSRPDALAQGPVEVALDAKGRPLPPLVQMAAAKTTEKPVEAPVVANVPAKAAAQPAILGKAEPAKSTTTKVAAAKAPVAAPVSTPAGTEDKPKPSTVKRWFGLALPGGEEETAQKAETQNGPAAPAKPSPRASAGPVKPQASLAPQHSAPAKPVRIASHEARPAQMAGATPVLPNGFSSQN